MKKAKILLAGFIVLTIISGMLAIKASNGVLTTLYTIVGPNSTCAGQGKLYLTTSGSGTTILGTTAAGGPCFIFKTTNQQQ